MSPNPLTNQPVPAHQVVLLDPYHHSSTFGVWTQEPKVCRSACVHTISASGSNEHLRSAEVAPTLVPQPQEEAASFFRRARELATWVVGSHKQSSNWNLTSDPSWPHASWPTPHSSAHSPSQQFNFKGQYNGTTVYACTPQNQLHVHHWKKTKPCEVLQSPWLGLLVASPASFWVGLDLGMAGLASLGSDHVSQSSLWRSCLLPSVWVWLWQKPWEQSWELVWCHQQVLLELPHWTPKHCCERI